MENLSNKIITVSFVAVAIAILFVLIFTGYAARSYYGTPSVPAIKQTTPTKATFGAAQPTGIVSIKNPRMGSSKMSANYDIELSSDVTAGLYQKSNQLTVANKISENVNKAGGLANDGLKSLLGLPSIPSVSDVLGWVVSWLNNNAPPCLRQIGEKYGGKPFKGTYTYFVEKGKGSAIYPDWDYFYATEVFRDSNGFMCMQGPVCVFSAKKEMANGKSRGYTGELSKSCFG